MKASNIFDNEAKVVCSVCGKNLLENVGLSMVVIVTDDDDNVVKVAPCCKGVCDKKITRNLPRNHSDGWKEFNTFTNPYLYLKHIMAVLNNLYEGKKFLNEEAFENYKELILNAAPYVMRDLTESEKQSAGFDDMMPF